MNCKDIQKNIILFYYHELDPVLSAHIEEHVHTCPECGKVFAELTSVLGKCEVAADDDKSPEFWEQFSAQVMEKISSPRHSPKRTHVWMFAHRFLPAGIVFAVLLLGIFRGVPHIKDYQTEKKTESELIQELDVVEDLEMLENLEFLESLDDLESLEGQEG